MTTLVIALPLHAEQDTAKVTILSETPVVPVAVVPVAFLTSTQATSPAEPAAEAPVEPEAPEPAPLLAPTGPTAPAPGSSPCGDALAWVAAAGLPLPDSVDYHCPSTQFAHHGAACWKGSPCPGRGFIAINMELMQDPTEDYLRHVVAHEVCHILDFQATATTTEARADACAAAHGAP